MKNKFGICLAFVLAVWSAPAATSINTWRATFTNAAGTTNGDTISFTTASTTRTITWTNAQTQITAITNGTPAGSATNLVSQMGAFVLQGATVEVQTNATNIYIRGLSLNVTKTGSWGTLTVVTNSGTNTFPYPLPSDNISDLTTRTNNSSNLVYSVKYSTILLDPTWPLMGNMASLTTSQTGSNKTWVGGVLLGNRSTNEVGIHGTNYSLYGGLYTSPRLLSPNTTNLVNQGNAISSIGSGSSSEQFGSGATASGTSSTAIGNASIATGNFSSALGWDAEADQLNDVAIGAAANASGPNALAVGTTATAVAINGVAIGNASAANFENSAALGYGAIANASNQVMLGSSSHKVSVPGRLEGNITNSIYGGTNRWKGDISWEEGTHSSMANTNNTIPAFTNAVLYLSGSTTAHDIAGAAGGRKGLRIRFYDSGTLPLTIRNLGGGASAGNRIRIPTGKDATLTNNPACFELDYNSTASEWNFIPLGN
jgi:hypothetical protein